MRMSGLPGGTSVLVALSAGRSEVDGALSPSDTSAALPLPPPEGSAAERKVLGSEVVVDGNGRLPPDSERLGRRVNGSWPCESGW